MSKNAAISLRPMAAGIGMRPEWHLWMEVKRYVAVDHLRSPESDGVEDVGVNTQIRKPAGASGEYPPDIDIDIPEAELKKFVTLSKDYEKPHYASIFYFIRTVMDLPGGAGVNVVLDPARVVYRNGRRYVRQIENSRYQYHWMFPGTANPCRAGCRLVANDRFEVFSWDGLYDDGFQEPIPVDMSHKAVAKQAFDFTFTPAPFFAYAVVRGRLMPCEGDAFEHMVYAVLLPEESESSGEMFSAVMINKAY